MSETATLAAVGSSYALAFVLASLGEYWAHRLMHMHRLKAQVHREHHRRNSAQGFLGELRDYLKGGLPCLLVFALPLGALVAPAAGAGFCLGGLTYGAFAAYAHQLQHENPMRCFWLPMPIHYVHHKYNMWHHNFGIALDVWDRVFGTYRAAEWLGEAEREMGRRGALEIKWV